MRKRLVLIGSNGMLASKVSEQASARGYEVTGLDLPAFDITNRTQTLTEISRWQPDVIINCAAYTDVDGAESEEELATRVNGLGPGYLAEAATVVGAILMHISTDYVFDGRKASPYLETDPVGPLSAYGRSKLVGERAIIDSGLQRYYIVRTSWLYGPNGRNFVETISRLAREREELRVVADQVGSPTYTCDLAEAIFALDSAGARRAPYGIYHYANAGQCSWFEFAAAIVEQLKRQNAPLKVQRLLSIGTDQYPLPATRPAYSGLSKEKLTAATGLTIPDWRESLIRFMASRNH